jgi:hypothetical protein
MEVEIDEAFRTTDLALATVLSGTGFVKFRLERQQTGEGAIWVFEDPPEDRAEEFERLIAAYGEGRIKVEPKTFARQLGAVRAHLYSFLDQGLQPDASRSRRRRQH